MLGFNSSLGQPSQVNFLIPGQDVQIGGSANRNGKTSTLINQEQKFVYDLE